MSTVRATAVSEGRGLVAAVGLAAALGVGFLPVPADAVVDCATASASADADGDGLSDAAECAGIGVGPTPAFSFAAGLTLPGGAGTSLPNCASVAGLARASCVDPNTKDFFVVIVRATPSLIPANPAQFISQSLSAGGLGITVHELAEGPGVAGDRTVIVGGTQKYLKVTESLAPATADDTDLGFGNVGTPNSPFAFATVFSQRIVDYHASVYGSVGQVAPAEERDRYILHTVAHEISHNLDLCACPDNPRYGGRHYKTGTLVVTEQSVKVTVKGSNVTFFISEVYPSADQTGLHLAP
jgi:hypothetical protein